LKEEAVKKCLIAGLCLIQLTNIFGGEKKAIKPVQQITGQVTPASTKTQPMALTSGRKRLSSGRRRSPQAITPEMKLSSQAISPGDYLHFGCLGEVGSPTIYDSSTR
jgi:hypothetical protein